MIARPLCLLRLREARSDAALNRERVGQMQDSTMTLMAGATA